MCMLFNRACKVRQVWGRVVEVGESGEGGRQCLVQRGALNRQEQAPVDASLAARCGRCGCGGRMVEGERGADSACCQGVY